MSLIHRRKSVIFNNPETSAERLKIQTIIDQQKNKLSITNQSSSKPKIDRTEKLSLKQAVKLEQLHSKMSSKLRRFSLNSLLTGFDRNSEIGIVTESYAVDDKKMDMFRSGVYYRSSERAKGAGVKFCDPQTLQDYFNCDDSLLSNKKIKKTMITNPKLKQMDYISTNATSLKSKQYS